MTDNHAQPIGGHLTPSRSRIESLDALRGVAVLGILAINIIGFGVGETGFSNPLVVGGDGALNHGLWTFSKVFIVGSMRGLFSLLFGASIILFTSRAPYPDGPVLVADLYYRRTIWLLIFGLCHSFFLLAPGDILLIYGIAGLFLFPLRILSPKSLLMLAAVLFVALTLFSLADELEETALGNEAARIEQMKDAGLPITENEQQVLAEWNEVVAGNWPSSAVLEEEARLRTGDLSTVFTSNAAWVVANSQIAGIFWSTLVAILMMLVGMALYMLGVLTGERDTRFYVRLAVIGYAIGLTFRIWAIHSRWSANFSPILWGWGSFDDFGTLAMTLGHVGLFFVLWRAAANSRIMKALTATGRMALTNYLGQSLIANLIFSGIGLGLFATMDFAALYVTMIGIWIAQLIFSVWWLSRYRYGPIEWVWRGLTYGHRP